MADAEYIRRVDAEGYIICCSRCGSEAPTHKGRERMPNEHGIHRMGEEVDFYWCVYCYETTSIGPAIEYKRNDYQRGEIAVMLAEGFNLLERQIKAHIDAKGKA